MVTEQSFPKAAGARRDASSFRPLATAVGRVAMTALGRHGQAFAELLTQWPVLVGPELGAFSAPVKLAFPKGERRDAVLTLRCSGAVALGVQHDEPMILARINAYFGFRAVCRLRVVQGPVMRRGQPVPPAAAPLPDPVKLKALSVPLGSVQDPALRAQLESLALAMASKRPGKSP